MEASAGSAAIRRVVASYAGASSLLSILGLDSANVDVLEILQENEIFGTLRSLPAFAVEHFLEIK